MAQSFLIPLFAFFVFNNLHFALMQHGGQSIRTGVAFRRQNVPPAGSNRNFAVLDTNRVKANWPDSVIEWDGLFQCQNGNIKHSPMMLMQIVGMGNGLLHFVSLGFWRFEVTGTNSDAHLLDIMFDAVDSSQNVLRANDGTSTKLQHPSAILAQISF